jgi:hypothetical protein
VSPALRRALGRIVDLPWGSLPSEEIPAGLLAEAWSRLADAILSHLERAPRTLRYLRA